MVFLKVGETVVYFPDFFAIEKFSLSKDFSKKKKLLFEWIKCNAFWEIKEDEDQLVTVKLLVDNFLRSKTIKIIILRYVIYSKVGETVVYFHDLITVKKSSLKSSAYWKVFPGVCLTNHFFILLNSFLKSLHSSHSIVLQWKLTVFKGKI